MHLGTHSGMPAGPAASCPPAHCRIEGATHTAGGGGGGREAVSTDTTLTPTPSEMLLVAHGRDDGQSVCDRRWLAIYCCCCLAKSATVATLQKLPRGLGHNLLLQVSTLSSSKMESSETDFFDFFDHPK